MQTAYEQANDLMNAIDDLKYEGVLPRGEFHSWKLAKRMIRKQAQADNRVTPIYVAVQSTVRCYGGPEEGGWWYNFTETEEVFKFWTARDALAKIRELREEYCDPRYGIYSAANRGEPQYDFVVTHDPSFWEANETKERPYYC